MCDRRAVSVGVVPDEPGKEEGPPFDLHSSRCRDPLHTSCSISSPAVCPCLIPAHLRRPFLLRTTADSILPSCTKAVLLQQAKDMGMTVEQRPVPWDEVQTFTEVAACGTAVVVTPIKSITRGGKVCCPRSECRARAMAPVPLPLVRCFDTFFASAVGTGAHVRRPCNS